MSDALTRYSAFQRRTPQSLPIPGREAEMVRNDAGGYVFPKDVWTRLTDFLILGTEGGTYYTDERDHTYRNVATVGDALLLDGPRAVQLAVEISTARPARATKNFPALYVVAAALASANVDTRRAAASAVPRVARTTDHLAHLFGYWKAAKGTNSAGGGPVTRRAWTNWFTTDEPDVVAYRILKAGQRKTGDGAAFRPGDLLRVARPTPTNPIQAALFRLAVGKTTPLLASGHLANAKAYYEAQMADTPAKAVKAINAYHVPWEFLPTEVLKSPLVWEALLPHLGATALIRNLARMTQIGVFGPLSDATLVATRRLHDADALARARIHPFDLLLAARVYGSGHAQPNPKAPSRNWTPNQKIVAALNRAYSQSFARVEPIQSRLIVAVDRSGSMGQGVVHGGSVLGSAYHVSASIAQILARISPNSHVLEFDTVVRPTQIREDHSLTDLFNLHFNGGGTNISSPIQWATANRVKADGFVILTDNETWTGPYGRDMHTSQALDEYRRRVNPEARAVIASTTAAGHSVKDPKDDGVVNVAGFDSALLTLVSSFIRPTGRGGALS